MTLAELARRLGAELVAGVGEDAAHVGEREVKDVAGIEAADQQNVTFVANPKYAGMAKSTLAAAVIVDPEFPEISAATLRIRNPYMAWAKAIEVFHPAPKYALGVHSTAVVADSARIGERAHVGAYVVIGENCIVGDDAVFLPHVVLYPGVTVGNRFLAHAHAVVREGCRLGDDVVLQNGAVIGADGFGFAKGTDGRWMKIVQSGPAVLEDSVEVQANSCVDRASVGETRVRAGVKIDNLVQVGHGSEVGENTLLCAQVGLAGSTSVGKDVVLAGQVGVAGHLTIGDGAIATAQSGIPGDVAAGAVVSGYPAMENRAWLRTVAAVNRLPELLRTLKSKGLILLMLGIAGMGLLGCHSKFVEADVINRSGAAVSLVEVDYPSASFGTGSIADGAKYHYRFKILGDGPTKVMWTDGGQKEHSVAGPQLKEGQEGELTVTVQGGSAIWSANLRPWEGFSSGFCGFRNIVFDPFLRLSGEACGQRAIAKDGMKDRRARARAGAKAMAKSKAIAVILRFAQNDGIGRVDGTGVPGGGWRRG
jgi:UDP-3-O-[3-hydroxymyristoyl] glucosamine N-acyltransferase